MQYFIYLTMPQGGAPVSREAPDPEKMAAIMKFHEDAIASGVIVSTGRLSPSVARIRRDGDEV